MDRPKMGFAAPVKQWLQENLDGKLDYYFSKTYLQKQNIFNIDATRKLISDFRNNKNVLPGKIWYFLMFQMWYQKWMIDEN